MSEPTAPTADTVVILSSELIARITEQYFNKTMFKQPVEIVDLKPTETGYMFSVAFVSKKPVADEKATPQQWMPVNALVQNTANGQRDSKGKFAKKE